MLVAPPFNPNAEAAVAKMVTRGRIKATFIVFDCAKLRCRGTGCDLMWSVTNGSEENEKKKDRKVDGQLLIGDLRAIQSIHWLLCLLVHVVRNQNVRETMVDDVQPRHRSLFIFNFILID